MEGGAGRREDEDAASSGQEEARDLTALAAAGLITQTDAHGNPLAAAQGAATAVQADMQRDAEGGHGAARRGLDDGCSCCSYCLGLCCCLPSDEDLLRRKQKQDEATLLPEQLPEMRGRKCLVLDLDETLVHSSFTPVPNPDYIIPVVIEGVSHRVYVLKRPGVDQFLERLGKMYEIVVFTASLAKYADPLLDMLDHHHVIQGRLFREACTIFEDNYVKDLRRLGRPVKQTIIVDNSPASYMFQPENAIAVSTFIDCMDDRELLHCLPFLESIKDVEDVTESLGSYPAFIAEQQQKSLAPAVK